MAQLEITNLPESFIDRLRKLAGVHGRDLMAEAAEIFKRGLDQTEAVEKELADIRALRAQMPNAWITDEIIRSAREEGRA